MTADPTYNPKASGMRLKSQLTYKYDLKSSNTTITSISALKLTEVLDVKVETISLVKKNKFESNNGF